MWCPGELGPAPGSVAELHRKTDDNGKPKQDVPPEAGGPGGDMGPYAIPKKNDRGRSTAATAAPYTEDVEGMPDYSIKVNVPLVNVDVLVTTKSGQFVPGLKKDNFRLFEDGAPQADQHLQRVEGTHHRRAAGGVCSHELWFHDQRAAGFLRVCQIRCRKTTGSRSLTTTCSHTSWWISPRTRRRSMER